MATVTGMTATAVQDIVDDTITTAAVDGGGDLILTKNDLSTVNAGSVIGPTGATGAVGPGAGPAGGATGQVLAKVSATDHDFVWQNVLRELVLNEQLINYTLVSGDEEDMVLINSATPVAVTVPANATTAFPLGTRIRVAQIGVGATTIASAGGVTMLYPDPLTPSLLGQGATLELIKIDTDTWIMNGEGNVSTTELGWQSSVPVLRGSGADPDLGTSPVKQGYYLVNSANMVFGGSTVRWGSGTDQGTGVITLGLPVETVNYEDDGYSPIGSVSLGLNNVTHKTGLLHTDGYSPSPWRGYVALDETLTYTATNPGNVGNVHWHFMYEGDV